MARDRIYTRTGDDGTTGLFYGGRARKDSELPVAYGTVDEAQAVIGLARAEARAVGDAELDTVLVGIERDLYVLMAELATLPENRHKLTHGTTAVTGEMVTHLEQLIDGYSGRFDPPKDFVVPGGTRTAALLDVARTVVRRAERVALNAEAPASPVLVYLNRLSDLLWTLARWQEGHSLIAKDRTTKDA
jgi:cob(I)alamin adenosyltransferase